MEWNSGEKGEALEIWEVHCLNQAADARRAAPGVTGVTGQDRPGHLFRPCWAALSSLLIGPLQNARRHQHVWHERLPRASQPTMPRAT